MLGEVGRHAEQQQVEDALNQPTLHIDKHSSWVGLFQVLPERQVF